MAERRMFSKLITDSDLFLDMPQSTQLLYFHISMHGDDDGFINNPKSIMRNAGCRDDDMKILIAKQFIIPFESGVIVIRHWKIHNYIRNDRYNETKCPEKSMIETLENKEYQLKEGVDGIPVGIPLVDKLDTQVRLGKDRIDKDKDILSCKQDDVNEIIHYLNEKTYSSYKATSKKTKSLIAARFNEGFTVDDFKTVIDKKAAEWLSDSKMSKFLRPETLFGTKFEGYLNQKTRTGFTQEGHAVGNTDVGF